MMDKDVAQKFQELKEQARRLAGRL